MKLFFILLASLPCLAFSQTNNFFVSNNGSDANSGVTPQLPRKSLSGSLRLFRNYAIANSKVSIGLQTANIFNESFTPNFPIEIKSYSAPNTIKGFSIMNGTETFNGGWSLLDSFTNIYKQDIPFYGFVGNGINGIGQYSFIYPFEIDTLQVKLAPFTARKPLAFVYSLAELEATPGAFYEPVTDATQNPKPIYIHTSDGLSPNSHPKFRYEMSNRDRAINVSRMPDCRFENIWARGYGAGHGALPAGGNAYFNKVIFGPGAGIHHVAIESGILNKCLFLRGSKNTNGYALVFYSPSGLNRSNLLANSIFLDIKLPIYAHTGSTSTSNYGSINLDNVYSFADSTETAYFMTTSNNDTVRLNHVYTDGHTDGYVNNNPIFIAIKNCFFKDVTHGVSFYANASTASIENSFIRCNAITSNRGLGLCDGTKLIVQNSIIHIKSLKPINSNAIGGYFITGNSTPGTTLKAYKNIFICEADSTKRMFAALTSTDNGVASTIDEWDYNVYILLKGKKFQWIVTNPSTNNGSPFVSSFEEWQHQSGQDKHSLFFDLRTDPRGLKAIFSDPENGDYALANTLEARQVAALGAGMIDPINCFIKKPTYEEAANIILNDRFDLLNSCRNPCLNNKNRVNVSFSSPVESANRVQLNWHVPEQQNVLFYQTEKAMDTPTNFFRVYHHALSTDSVYSFNDNDILPNHKYFYRLAITATNGTKCYSDYYSFQSREEKRSIVIFPNPAKEKISVLLHSYSGTANFLVTNALGQKKLSKDEFIFYGEPIRLDISKWAKGVYYLSVFTINGTQRQKFLIY